MAEPFYYGCCYYPEHWHPRRHGQDIARIADAGFNLIRIGEGAWGYFEPRQGEYQFDLFDRVLDLCRKHAVKVIFGTPTYCGPAWVASNYPEVLRWNYDRIPMKHGSRRNYTYCSEKYCELSDSICTALAEHYRDEKQIIGWQLDNEFNCHMDVSYSPADTLAWRKWLKEKYRTLDRLNQAWGTAFWSRQYDDWEQIDLPHPTAAMPDPTVLLDESRFISDYVVRFARRQADILRQSNKKWFITHNGLFSNVDGPKLAAQLDFFSHDQYVAFGPDGNRNSSYGLLLARSLSFPYGVLEQQSGPGGQLTYLHRTARPGQMRLWAWQSILHGARLLSYFRWRTCPYGAEQHWHGLIDQDNRDTRRLAEAQQLGAELKQLPAALLTAPVEKAVALMQDFDNDVNDRRINTYNRSAGGERGRWTQWLSRNQYSVDLLWPQSDLRGYKLLILPHLRIMDKILVDKILSWVKAGGSLLLGAQSGIKDRNCHIVEHILPGLWRQPAGVEVMEWSVLDEPLARQLVLPDGRTITGIHFVERLKILDAQPLGWWDGSDSLLGKSPALTGKKLGKGMIYYLGTCLDEPGIAALAPWLLGRIGIAPLAQAAQEVEVIARRQGKRRWIIALNHSAAPQRIAGLPAGKDLLGGAAVENAAAILEGYGVGIWQT